MRAHDPAGKRAGLGDLGYPDDRRVGRQDDVRTDERLHLLEKGALGLQVLEDALEHEIGPFESLVEPGGGGDQREGLLHFVRGAEAPFGEKGQVAPDPVAHPAKQLVVEALQPDLVPGHGEGLGASLAHHARADDGDPLLPRLLHRSTPARFACTQDMPSPFRPL